MPTVNINVFPETWTQIASPSDAIVLSSTINQAYIEYASTDGGGQPPVDLRGHILGPGESMTRHIIGLGFIWARVADDRAPVVRMAVTTSA